MQARPGVISILGEDKKEHLVTANEALDEEGSLSPITYLHHDGLWTHLPISSYTS